MACHQIGHKPEHHESWLEQSPLQSLRSGHDNGFWSVTLAPVDEGQEKSNLVAIIVEEHRLHNCRTICDLR